MGVIVPFTGGEGREVFDWCFWFNVHTCKAACWGGLLVFGLMSAGLLKVWMALACWELTGHTQPVLVGRRSWGPLALWTRQFSSDCFDYSQDWCRKTSQCLVIPGVQDNVRRDRSGVPWALAVFYLFIWVPGEYLAVSLSWTLLSVCFRASLCRPCCVCVTSRGNIEKWANSFHSITLTWFQVSITHMEWTSEFFHD